MIKDKFEKLIRFSAIGLGVFIAGNISLHALSNHYGFGAIVTKSIDKDYIVYSKDWDDKLAKNKIIFFKLPVETPYYKKDTNFGKYIKCEAGDKLTTQGLNYYCNDKLIGTALTTDSKGKPVSQFKYNGIIPQGNYFVMGTHLRSYDSRYWGFVNKDQIKGVAIWSM